MADQREAPPLQIQSIEVKVYPGQYTVHVNGKVYRVYSSYFAAAHAIRALLSRDHRQRGGFTVPDWDML